MPKKKLSQKDIEHGERQVKKMLKDRPVMRGHLTKDDFIWKWVVKKFAGEGLVDTIDWKQEEPYHGSRASHGDPCRIERGFICIKKGLSFEESWAGVIFELHNISLYAEFNRTMKSAYQGQITKEDFILKMARTEFKAIKKTEKFYKDVWSVWAKQKDLSSDPGEWSVGCPAKFEEWIKYFDKSSDYPWKIYSDFYDNYLEEWVLAAF